jgi:F0F1-type ATP synthase membrane subunit b/b'
MVGRYFGSRAHSIRETIQRSNRALADAEAAAHKAAESLRNLAAEKEKLNAGIESGTAFQVKTIREMAAASSQQIRRDAEITAAAAIESARRRIRERLASVTGAVARELVRANFTDQDQNRALDKFLTRLGDEARG